MKPNLKAVATLALALCSASAMAQSQHPTAQKDQETLMNLEERWMEAVKTNQPSQVAPMLAETFIQTQSNGRLRGKQALLDSLMDSKMKWQKAELSDVKVDLYGTAAVVTGRFTGEATQDDKAVHVNERWTDTWIRQDGSWKCVASHASELPEAAQENRPEE
jgi:hypothetical protein